MNHHLAKLRELELAVNQEEGFVSFVSPPTRLKSGDGRPKEAASVAEGFVSFVSEQGWQLENPKGATESDRQLLRWRACGAALQVRRTGRTRALAPSYQRCRSIPGRLGCTSPCARLERWRIVWPSSRSKATGPDFPTTVALRHHGADLAPAGPTGYRSDGNDCVHSGGNRRAHVSQAEQAGTRPARR